jgi:diguanylate cyclase (GGDEF)-like protein
MLMRLEKMEGMCLAVAGVIAVSGLLLKMFPGMSRSDLSWMQMPLAGSVAALACVTGLARNSRQAGIIRRALAVVALLAGLASLAGPATASGWLPPALNRVAAGYTGGHTMPWLVAIGFDCLAVLVFFAQAQSGANRWLADGMLFGAGWAVLTLVAGAVFGALHVFGAAPPSRIEPATAVVLALLTAAAVGRRAEYGSFSIFLGRGLGSRIARGILPVVLVLPLGRELLRARLTRLHLIPEHYAAAVLAAGGTMIALALLVIVSWQFRRLEWEIQSLSLRDELTGVYNLRGFQLLAEQALRMAQRSHMPFSVLFVDVDNLKQINDQLGHAVGSQMLVDTAEFLKTQFRETDILGRIGGDEFGVAGQFGSDALDQAEKRLDAQADGTVPMGGVRLSLSMGHVTADLRRDETLQDLLDRADAAMYQRKRTKKLQAI